MFNKDNYPKSFASISPNEYRLKDFLMLSIKELRYVEKSLWRFVTSRVDSLEPVKAYKNYKYIGSGWEWSAFFSESDSKVVKIPSGIFSEVNDERYLLNSKIAYDSIQHYFPNWFIAEASFSRVRHVNTIEQEYIEGEQISFVDSSDMTKLFLTNLREFLTCCVSMLDDLNWIPDIDISSRIGVYSLKNIVIEKTTLLPKLIDFTCYYDIYRLYPQRTLQEMNDKRHKIKQILSWICSSI